MFVLKNYFILVFILNLKIIIRVKFCEVKEDIDFFSLIYFFLRFLSSFFTSSSELELELELELERLCFFDFLWCFFDFFLCFFGLLKKN